jgi:hypothetical protein
VRMLLAVVIVVLSSAAHADGCISVDGAYIVNHCKVCMKVTVNERRAASIGGQSGVQERQDQSGVQERQDLRSMTIPPGERAHLADDARSAVLDIAECR